MERQPSDAESRQDAEHPSHRYVEARHLANPSTGTSFCLHLNSSRVRGRVVASRAVSPPLVAPIFIVGAPQSGEPTLLSSLALASGVWHARTNGASFLDALPEVEAATRDHESHRLTGDDAPAIAARAPGRRSGQPSSTAPGSRPARPASR